MAVHTAHRVCYAARELKSSRQDLADTGSVQIHFVGYSSVNIHVDWSVDSLLCPLLSTSCQHVSAQDTHSTTLSIIQVSQDETMTLTTIIIIMAVTVELQIQIGMQTGIELLSLSSKCRRKKQLQNCAAGVASPQIEPHRKDSE